MKKIECITNKCIPLLTSPANSVVQNQAPKEGQKTDAILAAYYMPGKLSTWSPASRGKVSIHSHERTGA